MNFELNINTNSWSRPGANRAADFKAHAVFNQTGSIKWASAQITQDMTDEEKTERQLEILDGLFDDANFESHYIHANGEGTYSFDFRHVEEGTLIKFLDTIDPQFTFDYYKLREFEDVLLIIDTERLPANEVENTCPECGMPIYPVKAALILHALLYHDDELYFPEDLLAGHSDEDDLDETEI